MERSLALDFYTLIPGPSPDYGRREVGKIHLKVTGLIKYHCHFSASVLPQYSNISTPPLPSLHYPVLFFSHHPALFML